jgi:hypothetical protein
MDVENFDIVKAPHSDKLRPTSFSLMTRKWYTERFANNVFWDPNFWFSYFIWWDVTDIVEIEEDVYDSFWCKTGEKQTVRLYMWISDDKRVKRVYDETWCNIGTIIFQWPHKPWASEKFLKFNFVRGKRRNITSAVISSPYEGIQINRNSAVTTTQNITQQNISSTQQNGTFDENSFDYINSTWDYIRVKTINNPTQWEFTDKAFENNSVIYNRDNWCDSINVWDYLYVNDYEWQYTQRNWLAWDGSIWAVNIIWWISQDKKTLLMQAWRDGFFPWQYEWWNLQYGIYPEYWPVIWRGTIDGMAIKHYDIDITYRKFSQTPTDIIAHNWQIAVYFWDTGWLQFWWVWTQQLYFTGITDVWYGRKSFATFRQFLVWFWEEDINVTVFNFDLWRPWSVTQKVLDNRTIFSKNSWDVSENSLYIFADNKRLYAVDIKFESTVNQFYAELKDSSAPIKWELALVQGKDEVSIKDNFNELRIFINGDMWTPEDNGVFNKTKMLIYNKDYWVRHRHVITNAIIKWVKYGTFYWSDVYNYCWYRDSILWLRAAWIESDWAQIKTKINFFMWETETNNQGLVPYNYKKLNYIKIMVWLNTKMNKAYEEDWQLFIYSDRDGTRPIRSIKWLNNMRYIEHLTQIKNWWSVSPTDCQIKEQIDCTNFFDSCEWGLSIPLVQNWCNCPTEQKELEDYGFCFEDKQYYMWRHAPIFIPLQNFHKAHTYKVELVTTWIIELYWFIVWYALDNPKEHRADYWNNWTCSSCADSKDFNNPSGSCWC